jgi:hypothetical protein
VVNAKNVEVMKLDDLLVFHERIKLKRRLLGGIVKWVILNKSIFIVLFADMSVKLHTNMCVTADHGGIFIPFN